MKINFLIGSLILRNNKTGVHLFYENLVRKFILNNEYNIKISVYETKKSLKKRYKNKIPFFQYLNFSFKLSRLLVYFLPVEIFFKRSDVYICDGIIPWTFFKGYKIAVVHDLMVFKYPQNYSIIKKIYLKYYFWQIKYKADYIITVSETTKKDIIKYLGVKSEKIGIVYNGINKPLEIETIKNIKGYSLNVKYFFSIGECRPNKNFLTAIKAFAKYKEQYKDEVFLYLAGNNDTKYGNYLKQYVKEVGLLDSVIFLGYISEIEKISLYKYAKVFIFVSEYEGFGVPIIEAMNYGVPVITTKSSSLSEIAKDAAILVEYNDEEAIKNALYDLNNNNKWNFYKEYGKKYCKRFSWDNAYRQFSNILRRLNNE